MDEFFYNPKGFKADEYDPRSRDLTTVTLFGMYHCCTDVIDYRIEYRISRVNMLRLVEILKEEGYYRKSLYHALAYKFGKKMDDSAFSSFLEENRIKYSRHFRTDSADYLLELYEDMYRFEYDEEEVPEEIIGLDDDL